MAMNPFDVTEVIRFLHDEVRPKAQIIDQDSQALRQLLHDFASHDWMALKRPPEFGGPGVNDADFRKFQEEVARVSGTFAFLQTQHQSAVGLITRSQNSELRQRYLPDMGNGKRFVGIGFSQLRRKGPPVLTATKTDHGYTLQGMVPWVTGFTFYPEFLVGATLLDGSSLFAVIPLATGPNIQVSEPMKLAAMGAALTVEVALDNYFVPENQVAFIREPGWIQNNDQINIALQGQFAVGNCLASLDIIEEASTKKGLSFLMEAHQQFSAELEMLRAKLLIAQADASEETTSTRLKLRAQLIALMGRCAHAAITSSSGAANYLDHPAQRVFRESLVFTVSAQTTAIMEATLNVLTHEAYQPNK